MNWISCLVLILIAAGFVAAVRHSGKHGCSCGKNCHDCTMNCRNKARK